MGPIWTPSGASPDYVGAVAAEMRANVYDLGTLLGRVPETSGVRLRRERGILQQIRPSIRSGSRSCFRAIPRQSGLSAKESRKKKSQRHKVTIVEKGVWDTETTLSFRTSNKANPGGHHISLEGTGDTHIPVTTIELTCERLNLARVDYVKMDIEGAEVRAIRGAARVIRESRPSLCVATEHTDDLFANAVAVLETMGEIDPSYRCICTEAHIYGSPSRGSVLTPYSLLFC